MIALARLDATRRNALFLSAILSSCLGAIAQEIPGYPSQVEAYDPREVAMLPPYCMHTQLFRAQVPGGSDSGKIQHWRSLLGESFEHLHHYCWGLMNTNRGVLLARGEQARHSYLARANEEFDYIIERSSPGFVLLPEILTKKGENLIRLGKGAVAVAPLQRAAELKPDYWPPYAFLSDYYKSTGNVALARETLERGLSFSPDTPSLKRRLSELGKAK